MAHASFTVSDGGSILEGSHDELAAKYIVAQYTGYPSFINEAGWGVFTDGAGLKDCLNTAIDIPRATRDAAGLAGREWLLEHQNYEKLARDYLRKIEQCVDVRP